MAMSPHLGDREQEKFFETNAGNTAVRTGSQTFGQTGGGAIDKVTLTDGTWTQIGNSTITYTDSNSDTVTVTPNGFAIQNRSTATTYLIFDTGIFPNGVQSTGTNLAADVTFTADTAGVAGDSISLVFDGIDVLDLVVNTWNAANPSNTVSHDGTGTDVLPAQTVNLSGGVDPKTSDDGWEIPAGGELFLDVKPTLIGVYVLPESGSSPDIYVMRIG